MLTIEQFYWGTPSAELFDAAEGIDHAETPDTTSHAEAVVTADPENLPALRALAELYTRVGQYERGLELDLRLTRLSPSDPVAWYNTGCSYSLLGDMRQSLESLRQALSRGYRDIEFMERDPDLEAVRGHPGFRELMTAFGRPARR